MAISLRIVICDDHALVRSGLRRLLEAEPGLEVVGEAANTEEAIERVGSARPDLLLLDVGMPGRSGIEALPDLVAAAGPATRVLVLSMEDDPSYVRQAFAAGANGYLLKEAAGAELVQAIHEVAEGRPYVHPLLGARLASAQEPAAEKRADPLTEREHDVLRLLARGHTNEEIAKLLFISIRTAETDRARIMQKLGLSTRAEIVRYALASGELAAGFDTQTA
jgi:two-component system response regulator NreC